MGEFPNWVRCKTFVLSVGPRVVPGVSLRTIHLLAIRLEMSAPDENPIRAYRNAMVEAGLWGAMPWAVASSSLLVGGLLLGMIPVLGCFGWVGAAIGAFLVGLLGLGGVVNRPWWRILGGIVVGEAAALSAVLASIGGAIATTQEGLGGGQILAVLAAFFATAASAAWAYLRWGAGPTGITVVAVWTLAVCVVPWLGYTLAYLLFGQSVFLPY